MGGEAKLTIMVLKVDLGCAKCYRKIKKVLCGTPQIRDQLFDEKSNTVTISVICCTPEKIKDKICSKAGSTIKDVDIKPSQPPKPAPPPQQKEGAPPQAAEKPKKAAPPPAEKPNAAPPAQQAEKPKAAESEKPKPPGGGDGGKAKPTPQQTMPPQQVKPNLPAAFMSPETIPVAGYPSIFPPVVYYDGGPYYQNQGMSAMPPPQRYPHQPVYQYDGYYGRPVTDSYRGGYRSDYFSEENPSTCSVM